MSDLDYLFIHAIKNFSKKCTGVFFAVDFKNGLTLMRGTNADAEFAIFLDFFWPGFLIKQPCHQCFLIKETFPSYGFLYKQQLLLI